jgi:hypothetical protein
MCIETSPMQNLRIDNSQSAKSKICGDAGSMTAHEGAAGELLLHMCLHEKD